MKIVTAPDPVLNTPTLPVLFPLAPTIITLMRELMLKSGGIGLAAPQVGIPCRFFITKNRVYANPKILNHGSKKVIEIEGCLSIPGVNVPVARWEAIEVEYQRADGVYKQDMLTHLDARVFQHELDHLDGILMTRRWAERFEAPPKPCGACGDSGTYVVDGIAHTPCPCKKAA